MFRSRKDAALQLADRLRDHDLRHPVVLAIPRGGAVVGAVLARELGADLEVVIVRKLRGRGAQATTIGAIAEGGEVYFDPREEQDLEVTQVAEECKRQLGEIARQQTLYRGDRPLEPLTDRSVLVVDDGIATGMTMMAALQAARGQNPFELILVVPVASRDRLRSMDPVCDEVVCIETRSCLWNIADLYADFAPVEEWDVANLLRNHPSGSSAAALLLG